MSVVEISRVGCLPVCTLGEGPTWDERSQCLVYVDILGSSVHRYYPATSRHQLLHIEPTASGKTVTFAVPVEGEADLLLVGVGRDVGLVRWSTGDPDTSTTKLCILATVDSDKPLNRLNDGKCDFKGQLWAGTMGNETDPGITEKEKGKLFVFSPDMQARTCVDKINLSNGMAWSADRRSFYYIDTCAFSVDAFDYDEDTDVIGNRRKIVDYRAVGLSDDLPDGMTIDTAGNLWVANYNGAKILCINPEEGRIVRTIELPVRNPTCTAWGGSDYSTLYVTTAIVGLTKEQLEANKDEGGVFKITGLGVTGTPPHAAKLSPAVIAKFDK